MRDITSLNYALKVYNKGKANNAYIIGFILNNEVYIVKRKTLPTSALYMDNGNLRMRIGTKTLCKWVASGKAIYCMQYHELLGYKDKSIKCNNIGEMIERYITELHGQKWEKDYIKFYEDADLTVGKRKYSIKYANNSTIARQASLKVCAKM